MHASLMSRNVTSVAPSGSGMVASRGCAVAPRDAHRERLASVERGDGGAQRLPGRIVAVQRRHQRDHRLDMRTLVERDRLESPHARERRIEQAQPAVAAEHRDRLAQIVERLALHADQRVEAALELEPFGDVVEQIGDAALRIRRGDDAQRAAVGQVPFVLARLDVA